MKNLKTNFQLVQLFLDIAHRNRKQGTQGLQSLSKAVTALSQADFLKVQ